MAAMTIEEAGQEILQGPYTECRRCQGKGYPGVEERDLNRNFFNICKSCRGTRKWLRGDYLAACVILGIDPPERSVPVTEWKFDGKSESIDLQVWDYALSDAQVTSEYFKRISNPSLGAPFSVNATFKKEYMGEWATNDDDERGRSGSSPPREPAHPRVPDVQGSRLGAQGAPSRRPGVVQSGWHDRSYQRLRRLQGRGP